MSLRSEAQAAYDALPLDAKAKVRHFADDNGRTWKAKMRVMWSSGRDLDCYAYRQLRNAVGPSGLDLIHL